ncbi:MAG: methylated-DNA--[protein]-cysteine S-methyltransferase [Gaiella sp.]
MNAIGYRYEADGWGMGEIWVDGTTLLVHDLAGSVPEQPLRDRSETATRKPKPLSPQGRRKPPSGTVAGTPSQDCAGFVSEVCRRFQAHLAGDPVSYDDIVVDVDLGTPFQDALLRAVRSVPWGEVASYGEIAALAGRPGAARAAGTFCAGNDLALVVPCHRIVASSGIGGYGSAGVQLKRRLLALERIRL